MKTYKLTDEELSALKEAAKPVPYLVIGGHPPEDPATKSMRIWEEVAKRVNCDVWSIQPASSGNEQEFEAEPLQ